MPTRAAPKANPRSRKTRRVIFHSPSPANSTWMPSGKLQAMPEPLWKKVRPSTGRGSAFERHVRNDFVTGVLDDQTEEELETLITGAVDLFLKEHPEAALG